MANRERNKLITIWVTNQEQALIHKRMAEFGTINMSAYMRKMACDGMIVNVDIPEVNEMVTLLRRSSSLLNQISARVNETGRIYDDDIDDMKRQLSTVSDGVNAVLGKLACIGK